VGPGWATCAVPALGPRISQPSSKVAIRQYSKPLADLVARDANEGDTRLWPLQLDGAFIVAQPAAILAAVLRGSRGWPQGRYGHDPAGQHLPENQ